MSRELAARSGVNVAEVLLGVDQFIRETTGALDYQTKVSNFWAAWDGLTPKFKDASYEPENDPKSRRWLDSLEQLDKNQQENTQELSVVFSELIGLGVDMQFYNFTSGQYCSLAGLGFDEDMNRYMVLGTNQYGDQEICPLLDASQLAIGGYTIYPADTEEFTPEDLPLAA